jgi:hypothetical protein
MEVDLLARSGSTFDCDPSAIDSILGRRTIGASELRIDAGHSVNVTTASTPNSIAYSIQGNQEPLTLIVRRSPPVSEISQGLDQERLGRLLCQQQAWYDAQTQAALAAEQLLQLCEHQQQPWLHQANPTRTRR